MLWLIILATILAIFWGKMLLKAWKLPPGPIPLPFVGNVLQFGFELVREGNTIRVFEKWARVYGPVFTFWLGGLPTVNICDWNLAQESMIKKGQLFAARSGPFLIEVLREGLGIIFSNGEFWLEQRRFALHSLRNFGLGRNLVEERIMLEVEYRSELLEKEVDESDGELEFDPQAMLDLTVGNVINRMLLGDRFTEDKEKRFFELKEVMDRLTESGTVLDFMIDKWNMHIPLFKQRLQKQLVPQKELIEFLMEQVEQRKNDIVSGKHVVNEDEPTDFVDAFLLEIKKNENKEFTSFTMQSLSMTLFDLWLAGQETTATTLHWALSYLTINPQFLTTLQDEIDTVTRKSRPLSLSDRTSTPYLNAVILETLRMSSIVPMNIWREAAEDVNVGGFLLEKGTVTVAQLSVIMKDRKVFDDADKFHPFRYIENPAAEQHVVAFGLGKRACLGESLARAELYLILGNLVSRFNFRASATKPPGMIAKDEKGTLRRAFSYNLIVNKRQ